MHLAQLPHQFVHAPLHRIERARRFRMQQAPRGAGQESVGVEEVLFEIVPRIRRLEIARAIRGYTVPENQILRARR